LRAANVLAGELARVALASAREIAPWQPPHEPPGGSPLAQALEALGNAVRLLKLETRVTTGAWELAVALTDGLIARRPP